MERGEWCRHCDLVLGSYWPSDAKSEGGPSALGQLSGADDIYGWDPAWGGDFIMLLRTVHNLKFMSCLFLEFSI